MQDLNLSFEFEFVFDFEFYFNLNRVRLQGMGVGRGRQRSDGEERHRVVREGDVVARQAHVQHRAVRRLPLRIGLQVYTEEQN